MVNTPREPISSYHQTSLNNVTGKSHTESVPDEPVLPGPGTPLPRSQMNVSKLPLVPALESADGGENLSNPEIRLK